MLSSSSGYFEIQSTVELKLMQDETMVDSSSVRDSFEILEDFQRFMSPGTNSAPLSPSLVFRIAKSPLRLSQRSYKMRGDFWNCNVTSGVNDSTSSNGTATDI